jgi:predicted ATP-binding protein involved in virulence
MTTFLTKIQVNKIFNLENFEIEIDSNEKKHLILTGKNGSGKTSLLKAMLSFLQRIKNDPKLNFYNILSKPDTKSPIEQLILKEITSVFEKVELFFNDKQSLAREADENNFLFAFYEATRRSSVLIPQNPDKPNLAPDKAINSSKTKEFVKFLVDLKIQEALARNENNTKDADEIKSWFEDFNNLLKELFETNDVDLHFNYKNYAFTIIKNGQQFGFNELSDGYSAIIDIIADLIIKMQTQNGLVRSYRKEGIVLIDEIETHLHLKLQRIILPMLTKVFPNIQFIVTTHSPFILSSLKNAVAYDLEKKTRLEDLTEYSYEALAEGYFKVDTDSLFLSTKLERFKELSEKANRDSAEEAEYISLDKEFDSLDEAISSPAIKGQYLGIKLKNIKLG